MSPEQGPDLEQLAFVEKIITALQSLQTECEARDLKNLAKHIELCAENCQGEYVDFHIRFYESGGGTPDASDTEH